MLIANNLSYMWNNKELFKGVNISITPKNIIHLKGRNGIGKTTLIKILISVLVPNTGEIYWAGKNIKKHINEFLRNITFIMDSQTSHTDMTIEENIFFWKKLFSSKITNNETDSILSVLGLNKYKTEKISNLSFGESKKLEFCRLVIEKKQLWIMDEPYAGIDDETCELLDETFKNHIKKDGMIIFSSHRNTELQNIETIQLENYAHD